MEVAWRSLSCIARTRAYHHDCEPSLHTLCPEMMYIRSISIHIQAYLAAVMFAGPRYEYFQLDMFADFFIFICTWACLQVPWEVPVRRACQVMLHTPQPHSIPVLLFNIFQSHVALSIVCFSRSLLSLLTIKLHLFCRQVQGHQWHCGVHRLHEI